MNPRNVRPKWWQVYLAFPLLIALFMVDSRLKLSVRGHQTVQLCILVFVYGLIHVWLKANAIALSNMDRRQINGKISVTRIPSYQLSDAKSDKRPMFQLSDSEIKGTLSNTFEMEIINAKKISVDEVVHELNKE